MSNAMSEVMSNTTSVELFDTSAELFDSNCNRLLSAEERAEMTAQLQVKFAEILAIMRIDPEDPNSADTPRRLAKMWSNELFVGRFTAAPPITVFPNRKNVDELVVSNGIKVLSVCSHHWQPIIGECFIGYVPRDKVIGISKFNRIVDWFSRRGQIQEELGQMIADYIEQMLDPVSLGVVIRAKHYCMISRGVQAHESAEMVTSVMRGDLATSTASRAEFMSLIHSR